MKKFTLLFIVALAFIFIDANAQTATKFATAHVENGNGDTQSGRMYRVNAGASRDGNGNSNGAFGNIGDWSVDFTISEKTPVDAYNSYGNQNPSLDNGGFGAIARASFAAGNYTRAHSLGSVAMGFLTIAGQDGDRMGEGPFNGIDGGNVGQVAFGWRSVAFSKKSKAAGTSSSVLQYFPARQ
jgi:hypothetical protein